MSGCAVDGVGPWDPGEARRPPRIDSGPPPDVFGTCRGEQTIRKREDERGG